MLNRKKLLNDGQFIKVRRNDSGPKIQVSIVLTSTQYIYIHIHFVTFMSQCVY